MTTVNSYESKLPEFQQALSALISRAEGLTGTDIPNPQAYLTALAQNPTLIETESNPRLFLRREKGSAWQAATLLLNYWTWRLKFFGPDRAFRPLVQALQEEDKDNIRAGFIVQLPRDQQGRDVICVDTTRRLKGHSTDIRGRSIFYVASLTMNNPLSQTEGFVLLVPLTEKSPLDVPGGKAFGDFFQNVLPVQIHSVHLAGCPGAARPLFKKNLIPAYTEAAASWCTHTRAQVTMGKSPADLAQKLHNKGLVSFPETIGGSWKYQDWENRLTTLFLEQKPPAVKPLKKRAMPEESTKTARPARSKVPQDAKFLEQAQEEGCREETIRSLKDAMSTTTGRCADQDLKTAAEKDAFLRKRDAVYSKRKYYKKKLKYESLVCGQDTLIKENAALKKEHARLKSLYAAAQKIAAEVEQKPQSNPVWAASKPIAPGSISEFLRQQRRVGASSESVLPVPVASPPPSTGIADLLRQRSGVAGPSLSPASFPSPPLNQDSLRLLLSSLSSNNLNTNGAQPDASTQLLLLQLDRQRREQELLRTLGALRSDMQLESSLRGLLPPTVLPPFQEAGNPSRSLMSNYAPQPVDPAALGRLALQAASDGDMSKIAEL